MEAGAVGKKEWSVNCSVYDENVLHFLLTAELAKCEMVFVIEPAGEAGQEIGRLRIQDTDKEFKIRYESKPFPTGSIKKKDEKLKTVERSHFYKVKLKRIKLETMTNEINLSEYFSVQNKRK